MEHFNSIIEHTSDFLMTYIISALLIFTGLLYTFRLKFFQFRYFPHILKQTVGQIFKKEKKVGTITPFQAFTSTLGTTAGATNIVGVAVAISFGGPGALFWMWAVAVLGMATKYSEIVLGLKYREQNEDGEWVGGPMYYIKKGLGWKPLAWAFAFFLMLELFPSAMVQSNSISTQLSNAFGWNKALIGIILAVLTGLVALGGIKRIGKVSDKLVPFMVISYVVATVTVIIAHIDQVPEAFALIFKYAFTPASATGGFAGAAVSTALRWGIARGLYSNEAGIGTAPFAHAAAQTDHPSKQAIWGMLGVFMDTIVICSLSGFAVLTTGVWKTMDRSKASSMVDAALSTVFGDFLGSLFVAVFLFLFVITTIVVLIYYGEKQAEYLFGLRTAKMMRYAYLAAIFIGAIGGLQQIWQFLDILLAAVTLINLVPLILLNGEVREISQDYINRYIKKKKDTKPAKLFFDEKSS